jgi:adenine-specific DNA-methyltransferase
MLQQPEKFEAASANITDEQKAKLKSLFPEIITESGKVDFDRLKLTLGESVDIGKERYGVNWPGKADCFRTIQRPSMATLVPARNESVNFETTENLFIEGDNLETLKLLQKAYLGKVKMIYIDPPYNTGNDFIYPDDYSETLETYLRYTGQVDSEGKKFSTNTEVDGRFHSKWLTMMYPRLFLARNLLREDGVLMCSISDIELPSLRRMLDEIFGEENFLATFVWVNEGNIDNASKIKINHEYIVAYARSELHVQPPSVIDPNISKDSKLYREFIENTLVKNGPGNPESSIRLPVGFPAGFERGIVQPKENFWPKLSNVVTVKDFKIENEVTVSSGWSSKEIFEAFIRNNCKPVTDTKGQETTMFLSETGAIIARKKRLESQSHVLTILKKMGTVQAASGSLAELGIDFPYPKPTELLEYLVKIGSGEDDIVMDFFAGSGSVAHAILNLNNKSGRRHFLLVQLPQPIENSNFTNIADLAKERIRRVITKLNNAELQNLALQNQNLQDRGFKVFKLQSSNFKAWNAERPKDDAELAKQLTLHVDHLVEGRAQEDVLYELLLKSGFPLDTKVEKATLAEKSVFSIADGAMLICLEKELTPEVIKAIAEKKPERVVCLDAGFADNDQLKTNAVQTMKSKGVTKFQTV